MTSPSTTATALAAKIRDDIDQGVYRPGTILRQEDLAQRYDASRIPVREALQMLHAQGLVIVTPNKGAQVASLQADEIEEIFELRAVIETRLLQAAIARHTPQSLARLKAAQLELEAQNTRSGWLNGDARFHEALYAPANKPRTLAIARNLRDQVARYALGGLGPDSRRAEWAAEHRELIDAVEFGRGDDGCAALARHLAQTKATILAMLSPPPVES